jgi:hypothetical protein
MKGIEAKHDSRTIASHMNLLKSWLDTFWWPDCYDVYNKNDKADCSECPFYEHITECECINDHTDSTICGLLQDIRSTIEERGL